MGARGQPILPKSDNRLSPGMRGLACGVPRSFRRRAAFLIAIALMAGIATVFTMCRPIPSPDVTVWAWERNEDLEFIDPRRVKVAYLAGTIYLRDWRVSFRPRHQQLKLPPGADTMPVFRIVSIRDSSVPPPLTSVDLIVNHIATHLKTTQATKVQIDFDAVQDERPFYKSLLEKLRSALPARTRISITALASWLLHDRWLPAGAADEAVAMLFSMGPARDEVLSQLKTTPLDASAATEIAVGLSANEKDTNVKICQSGVLEKAKSIYLFNSHPWTESRFRKIEVEVIDK